MSTSDPGRPAVSSTPAAPTPADPLRSAVTIWTVGRGARRFSVRAVEGTSMQELDELADRALATLARLERSPKGDEA